MSTLTNCISLGSMPSLTTIMSATHIEVGSWHEDIAGCDPTGETAKPTNGTFKVEYFLDGSELLTFFKDQHQTCGRTQNDVRWRGADGQLYRYQDSVVNTEVDCGGMVVARSEVFTPAPVPEPSTFILFATVMLIVWIVGKRA